MEDRKRQLQEEIGHIVEKIGPGVSNRVGRFLTTREQEWEPDVEDMSDELKADYADLFHKKAEIEALEYFAANSDDARAFHQGRESAFLALRNLFRAH